MHRARARAARRAPRRRWTLTARTRARSLPRPAPRLPQRQAFAAWRDTFATVLRNEKNTRLFPVMLLVDNTQSLPQRPLLRVTPTEIAIVNVDDKDVCYSAIVRAAVARARSPARARP